MNSGRSVALVVAAAFFMEQVDATILVTATASIAADFGVAPSDIGVALSAYFVAVAALIPVSGWLSDRFGARRVFLCAIVGFLAASVLCGASVSLPMLVAGRIAQGAAGAMMVPVGRYIVLGGTPKADLVRAVAYLTWPALAAPVFAPFLGGLLTERWGWRWIFLVNVPLGLVLALVAWWILPRSTPESTRRLDLVTLLLVLLGVGALVTGLELVGAPEQGLAALVLVLGAGLALGAATRRAWLEPTPLLDLRALTVPTFRVPSTGGAAYRIAVGAAPFLLPLLLQDGFGWSPVQVGLMVMWIFVGNLAIKPFTTPLLRALGFRWMIVGASIGLAGTYLVCAMLTPSVPVAVLAATLLLSGAFRSIGFTAYGTLQFADVPPEWMNGASTLSAMLVQLANGLGIALVTVGLRAVDATRSTAADGIALLNYRAVLVTLAVVAVASIRSVWRLPAGVADHVRWPAR